MTKKYALGLDYGTESVRAILIDIENGDECGVSVSKYAHGVMSPFPDFALQDPKDYLESGWQVIREVTDKLNGKIIGIGVDFTACTMLPVDASGTPLAFLPEFKNNPHALVKLWKHHGAQKEADQINELAKRRKEKFLDYYGGVISCEWMIPKVFETLNRAPEVFNKTHWFVDAGDWIVFKLTGEWTRSATFAGYKGFWSKEAGYPSTSFLKELHPALENIERKWISPVAAPGTLAGVVKPEVAFDLNLGTDEIAVSVATIDAHSGVPGMGVYQDRTACLIMGTSTCHMFLSGNLRLFKGMAGAVSDGIIPGLIGYESGQAAVGDLFAWFAKKFLPGSDTDNAFDAISKKAYAQAPGEHGLVALDWMNGNRSPLMNNHLTGMIMGLTLDTLPHEVFRALVEATAFGTKKIIDTYEQAGIPVETIAVCGGLSLIPDVMKIYADILERPIVVAESHQAVALGAAIFGALAAGSSRGGFDHIEAAVTKMTKKSQVTYTPNANHYSAYRELYSVYKKAHDFFGVDHPEIMQGLKNLKLNSIK